jgi:hypothetical protein
MCSDTKLLFFAFSSQNAFLLESLQLMEFKATQKKVTVRRDGTLTSVPIILGKTGTHHMFLDQLREATWQAPLIRADYADPI